MIYILNLEIVNIILKKAPELINDIRTKTGDYSSKLPHLTYEEEINKKINNIEYDYSDDILKLNDDIKMKLRLKFN